MSQGKTLLIACGAIAHELVALKKLNSWNIDIKCLPAELHNRPEKITPQVEAMLEKHLAKYDRCYLAYADCGTGGHLDRLLEQYNIERLPGAHCYEFFAGSDTFAAWVEKEPATFFLTDFLVKHFDRIIFKDLGLEKHPELKDLYFGNYRKLLFIDQSGDKSLQTLAKDAAKRLGLEYEYLYSGMQSLESPIKFFLERPDSQVDVQSSSSLEDRSCNG